MLERYIYCEMRALYFRPWISGPVVPALYFRSCISGPVFSALSFRPCIFGLEFPVLYFRPSISGPVFPALYFWPYISGPVCNAAQWISDRKRRDHLLHLVLRFIKVAKKTFRIFKLIGETNLIKKLSFCNKLKFSKFLNCYNLMVQPDGSIWWFNLMVQPDGSAFDIIDLKYMI